MRVPDSPRKPEPITYPTHPLPGGQFRNRWAIWFGPVKCQGKSGAILLGRRCSHLTDMQESDVPSVHLDLTQLGCNARIFSSHFVTMRRQEREAYWWWGGYPEPLLTLLNH